MQKTHKTAVVIIPPKSVWQPLQNIREKYDRQFKRWMPHITLLYPFRPRSEFDSITNKFSRICSHIHSFTIELKSFFFFSHGKQHFTLWLAPEPKETIIHLQSLLWDAVPDCDDVSLFKNGFTPPLSIGQLKTRTTMLELLNHLQKNWTPIRFTVDTIFLIWRQDPPDDIFQIYSEIRLKKT